MGQALKMCANCENKRGCDTCIDLHNWIMEHIDTEPVRHGKWIVTAGGKQCTCSVCGEEFDNTCNYDIRKDWKCCPVCRCLMDGE